MDKSRSSSSSKHSKKRVKKSSKKSKRHRRFPYIDDEHDSKYDKMRSSKDTSLSTNKLVEYSDVSSEDFSAPEAGEIQDEEILLTFNDRDGINKNNGSTSKRYSGGGGTAATMASGIDNSSTPTQRKIIVGSPISSSLSSHSRSQHRHVRNSSFFFFTKILCFILFNLPKIV